MDMVPVFAGVKVGDGHRCFPGAGSPGGSGSGMCQSSCTFIPSISVTQINKICQSGPLNALLVCVSRGGDGVVSQG